MSLMSLWQRVHWNADTASAEWSAFAAPAVVFLKDILGSVIYNIVCTARQRKPKAAFRDYILLLWIRQNAPTVRELKQFRFYKKRRYLHSWCVVSAPPSQQLAICCVIAKQDAIIRRKKKCDARYTSIIRDGNTKQHVLLSHHKLCSRQPMRR